MENLVLNIFCSMTLFKKIINYGDISEKLIFWTFTSSSLFSNSSNVAWAIKGCNNNHSLEIHELIFHWLELTSQ